MDPKHEILRQYFGYTEFRPGQAELIDAQLSGRDVFGIMPTGGGKSLCYQIPAMLSTGITVVISPLISLMKDQVAALKQAGIPAAYLNSSLTADQSRAVCRNLVEGKYRILYVAPERLLTESFLQTVLRLHIAILTVDEAHCISQWGQDFRPSYLRIVDFLKKLYPRPVVSAFTATATPEVRQDVEHILGLKDPLFVATGFDRPNLRFEVRTPRRKMDELLAILSNRESKSGIVYCTSRKNVDKLFLALQEGGYSVTKYHAGLSEEERRNNQEDFIYDRKSIMVATNAFGMGINKSNVSYVVHYNMPGSIEAYYQEAGRAGRDGEKADCILLYNASDISTVKFFIRQIYDNPELTRSQQEQIAAAELVRLDRMISYCKTYDCLRGYILDYFGEEHGDRCKNCSSCSRSFIQRDITTSAKMILSCVKRIQDRLGYGLGKAGVVRVLTGSREKRITSLGLSQLSTYGLMNSISRPEVREMIESLEQQGYLFTEPETPALYPTSSAAEVLFHGKTVTMPVETGISEEKPKPKKEAEPEPEADRELFDALKALRKRLAQNDRVPPYVIFSNATLTEMAAKKPSTMLEFLDISGVGQVKAEKYGVVFLSEIKKHRL